MNVPTREFCVDGLQLRLAWQDSHVKWFFGRHPLGTYHEEVVSSLWTHEACRGGVIFDVGCHVGWFTCLACLSAPLSTVYGFDISDEMVLHTRQNLALNMCRNGQAVHVGLSDKAGWAYFDPAAKAGASIVGRGVSRACPVRTTTIDEWCGSNDSWPSLVKIDAEGAELDILRGMDRTLGTSRPRVFVEVHGHLQGPENPSPVEVVRHLLDRGYEVREVLKMKDGSGQSLVRSVEKDSPVGANSVLFAQAIG